MSNKVALITGVGPGTGSSIARRFSKGGYKIAMIARDKERLKKLEDELEGSKGYSCELRNPEYLYNTIDEIIEDFGSPNLFIHNAVRGTRGNFLEFTSEELQSNFDINVMALHRIAQKVAPEMIKNKSGAIIVTGNTSLSLIHI